MRLLYITQFFSPEITAAAFRAYEHSRIWAKNIEVTVYTGNPNYPKGELHEGYKNQWITSEMVEGVKVIRAKTVLTKNVSKIGRIINSLSFLGVGIVQLIFSRGKIGKKYDIILATSGPVFAALLGYIFALRYKAKFIFEIRDITYIQMQATMGNTCSRSVKFVKFMELFLAKRADCVVVVTDGFKKILVEEGIEESKIEIIYNGVNKLAKMSSLQIQKDRLTIIYAGTIGISQEIKELIHFFSLLKMNRKQLIIVGEGAQKDIVSRYVRDNNIQGIEVYNAVPSHKLNNLLEKTWFGVVKLKYNECFAATIPSKLFDLMQRSIPVLYLGPEGEASKIIHDAKGGIVLNQMNSVLNSREFEKWIENHNKSDESIEVILKQMGENGRKYVQNNYIREDLAEQYLQIFSRVCGAD